MQYKRLSKTSLLLYGQLAFPLAMIGLPLYVYIPAYYDSVIGVSTLFVGIILFLARLTDVFTDPYIGFLSDKCVSQYGSRKPLVFLGIIITVLSFFALIYPIESIKELWLLLFSILIYIGWSLITIPYLTWSAEISDAYHEKTKLNTAREIFTIVGLLFALLIPFIFNVSDNTTKTLQYLFYSFVILLIPVSYITLNYLKIERKVKEYTFTIKELFSIYKSIPSIKRLQLAYLLNSCANALPATLFLYFVQFVLKEPSHTGLLLILYFLSGVIALPFWLFISKQINKKPTWIYSIILASCSFIFVIFLEQGDLEAFIIICIVSGLSLGADMALPSSIQSDVVQHTQKTHSESYGILFGIWSMITKLSLALAVAMSFMVLGLYGFDANNPSDESLVIITLLYALLPVALKVITLIVLIPFKEINTK